MIINLVEILVPNIHSDGAKTVLFYQFHQNLDQLFLSTLRYVYLAFAKQTIWILW